MVGTQANRIARNSINDHLLTQVYCRIFRFVLGVLATDPEQEHAELAATRSQLCVLRPLELEVRTATAGNVFDRVRSGPVFQTQSGRRLDCME